MYDSEGNKNKVQADAITGKIKAGWSINAPVPKTVEQVIEENKTIEEKVSEPIVKEINKSSVGSGVGQDNIDLNNKVNTEGAGDGIQNKYPDDWRYDGLSDARKETLYNFDNANGLSKVGNALKFLGQGAIEKFKGYSNMQASMMIAGGVDPELAKTGGDILAGELCGTFVGVTINGVRAFKNLATGEIVSTDAVLASGLGSAANGGKKVGSLVIEQGGKFSNSEIKAAEYMRDLGNEVILRMPQGTRAGGGTSDLLVNGVNYDVYTPITSKADRIISAIAAKKDQAVGIVLDMSQTSVKIEELGDVTARLVGKGVTTIKDIIIIK